MAIIPNGQKIQTLSANVDTKERGSSLTNSKSETYTMSDVIETVNAGASGLSYKVLTILVNQFGTNDPTVSVLENTLGVSVTAARLAGGFYEFTFSESLSTTSSTKIAIFASPQQYNSGGSSDFNVLNVLPLSSGIAPNVSISAFRIINYDSSNNLIDGVSRFLEYRLYE